MSNGLSEDEEFLLIMGIGQMLRDENKKSGGNSGCLSIILAVVIIPAVITWVTLTV